MNRIRQVGKIYQTLITPHQKYNTGFEYLMGSWTDEAMMGFEVHEYTTYNEAECDVDDLPDINWDQLVEYHKDAYIFLKDHIQKILAKIGIATNFKSLFMTPEQAKNAMFDRVIKGQEMIKERSDTSGFRTVFNLNDIISFSIINPWSKNLQEIELILMRIPGLRLFSRLEKNNIIHLIGRTDIGTTYEIVLMPSVLANWMDWRDLNKHLPQTQHLSTLKNCIRTQKIIDTTPLLR